MGSIADDYWESVDERDRREKLAEEKAWKESDTYKSIQFAILFDTLKFTPRMSTKRFPIDDKESVGIHIFEVMYLGFLVYHEIKHLNDDLDWGAISSAILTHEMEEPLTSDIPHSAKTMMRNKGYGDAIKQIAEVALDRIEELTPSYLKDDDCIMYHDLDKTSSIKKFVKFLDYVGLLMTCIRYDRKGYPVDNTIFRCHKLIKESEYYEQSKLVQKLLLEPELFLDVDMND